MTIPILIEPHGSGFRARTGGPFDITADAPSADDAVAAVRRQLDDRVRAGAVVVPVPLPVPIPALPPILPLDENPLFDDFLKAVEEGRRERDAADAAADTADAARGG
jgi:hypothetical protein